MLLVLRKRWLATIVALLALLHKTPPTGAFEVRWICNVDGDWANADCWSTGEVPSSLTPGADVVIGGTLPDADVTVTVAGATVGSLTMEAGDTLHLHRATFGTGRLTVLNDITNDGSILLSAVNRQAGTGGAAIASLVTTDGALINNTTGVLHFVPGGGFGTVLGQRTFTGDLVNHGTVLVEALARFDKPGGEYVNHADFDARSLTITSGGTFEQATGTLAVSGLTLQDASTLNLAGGTITMELSGLAFRLQSGSVFTQQAGTFEYTSGTISGGTFNYLGGTITGAPRLENVTLNIGPAATAPASFLLIGNNTLASNVHAGQTLTVQGTSSNVGAELTSATGFTNDGMLLLASPSGPSSLRLTDGTLTNSAAGILHFNNFSSTFTGDLVNDGSVIVGHSTTFDKPGGQYLNNGHFAIVNNGALTITSGGTLQQVGGTLEVARNITLADGSVVTQQGGTLEYTAGTISGGTFNYLGGTITGTPLLQNVMLNIGPAATEPVSFLLRQNNTLIGDVHAGQTLTVDSLSFNAELISATGFTNDGSIVLTASSTRNASLRVTDGTLVNSATGLLHSLGTGSGGNTYTGDLVNDGTILIERGTTLDKQGGQYVNHGSIDEIGGGNLTITSPSTLSNHGLLRGRGSLQGHVINEGRLEGRSSAQPLQIDGWLTGSGELQDVRIAGTHAPGATAPELEGVYTLTSAATLIADIGGTTPGTEHTQLDATGTVNLGGQLQVRSIDAGGGIYLPTLGEQFTILASANPINGAFTNTTAISIASGTRIDWDIMQLTNEVVLEAAALTPLVPGDYNGNGVVDAADYTVWRDMLGSSNLAADGNVDGVIDGDDYDVWRANFGAMGGSSATIGSSSHAVPEPTTLRLLLLAATLVTATGRRRSSRCG